MAKRYTILQLLEKQPVSLKKTADFKVLADLYRSDASLKRLYLSSKCHRLINKGRILSDKLNLFYKRFNLPKHSFFPLFFKLKSGYFFNKQLKSKQKNEYILKKMRSLPLPVQEHIRYFGNFEKSSVKTISLWNKVIYPGSKKKADDYLKFGKLEWIELFKEYTGKFRAKYKTADYQPLSIAIALFMLELPVRNHADETIKKSYRILSKKYHPDAGGDPAVFKRLKNAYDMLIDRKAYVS